MTQFCCRLWGSTQGILCGLPYLTDFGNDIETVTEQKEKVVQSTKRIGLFCLQEKRNTTNHPSETFHLKHDLERSNRLFSNISCKKNERDLNVRLLKVRSGFKRVASLSQFFVFSFLSDGLALNAKCFWRQHTFVLWTHSNHAAIPTAVPFLPREEVHPIWNRSVLITGIVFTSTIFCALTSEECSNFGTNPIQECHYHTGYARSGKRTPVFKSFPGPSCKCQIKEIDWKQGRQKDLEFIALSLINAQRQSLQGNCDDEKPKSQTKEFVLYQAKSHGKFRSPKCKKRTGSAPSNTSSSVKLPTHWKQEVVSETWPTPQESEVWFETEMAICSFFGMYSPRRHDQVWTHFPPPVPYRANWDLGPSLLWYENCLTSSHTILGV